MLIVTFFINLNTRDDRIGEIRTMNCGYKAEIIEYKNANNITVRILETNEIIKNVIYKNFIKGAIKSHFSPTVYNWGIIGTESITDENGVILKSYKVWNSMIGRCYGKVYHKRNPNYIGCEVCDEWKFFNNFKKWFDENYYTLDNEDVQLDKDLICNNLGMNNKLYSPNTCLFIPKSINVKLTNLNKKNKFSILPNGKFRIKAKNKSRKEVYDTYDEALTSYKEDRLLFIRKSLECYKDKIPFNVYNEIYNIKIN